jgi:hypothetical protein
MALSLFVFVLRVQAAIVVAAAAGWIVIEARSALRARRAPGILPR